MHHDLITVARSRRKSYWGRSMGHRPFEDAPFSGTMGSGHLKSNLQFSPEDKGHFLCVGSASCTYQTESESWTHYQCKVVTSLKIKVKSSTVSKVSTKQKDFKTQERKKVTEQKFLENNSLRKQHYSNQIMYQDFSFPLSLLLLLLPSRRIMNHLIYLFNSRTVFSTKSAIGDFHNT